MKKNVALMLVIVFLTATYIVTPQPVQAEPRTIVVPDDYPTITAAVGNATNGDVILVRKGTYDSPVNQTLVIDKTISLIGEDVSSTKIRFHPAWITEWIFANPVSYYAPSMQIIANDVKLEGFTIIDDGWYIQVEGDGAQIVGNIFTKNVKMTGSYQTCAFNTVSSLLYPNGTIKTVAQIELRGNYSRAAGNTLINAGTIVAFGYFNSIVGNTGSGFVSTGLTATSNLIYGNNLENGFGIGIATTGNIVANNTVTNCTSGIDIIYGSHNIVAGNSVTNCPGIGIHETGNAGNNTFYANHVANNLEGAKIVAERSYNTTLYHNNFVNNGRQINTDKNETTFYSGLNFTQSLTHSGNFDYGMEGNYWSDYTGADSNGDGIGDTPYVIDENRSDYYPLMTAFDISSVTIQLPEWANVTSPNPLENPSFPPAPSPSPSPTPTPSPSPSPSPTPSPSPSPSPTATPSNPEPFPTALVIAPIASVAVIGVGLLVYFKKRKR
jgi:nitrous oxidase accessory protein NosD